MAKRTRLDWFAFYPDDFMRDKTVRKMTLEERGAYIAILCELWREPTPGVSEYDEEIWAAWARTDVENWRKISKSVLACFNRRPDGKLEQKRLISEWREAKKRHVKYVVAGSKGGKKSAKHRSSKGSSDAGSIAGSQAGSIAQASTVLNNTIHNITSNQSELDILAPVPVPAPARGEAGLTADAVPSAEPSETETERIKRNAGPAIEQVVMWMRNGTGARQDVLYTQIAREWLRSGTWKELKPDRWCGMAQNYATRLVDVKRYQAERVMFCWACCELTDNCACKGQERGQHYQSIRVPAGTKHAELPKWILDNVTISETQP